MIERTDGIRESSRLYSGSAIQGKTGPARKEKTETRTEPGETFVKDSDKGNRYLIIPPNIKQKAGIFKAAERELKKMDVEVQEKLPVIGGYVADLDESRKNMLEDAGYIIFSDEKKCFLPRSPYEEPKAEMEKAGRGSKTVQTAPLEERPPLQGPRFDTPLCRQYNGKGVTIAVIDTGIHPHPDFNNPQNRIRAFVDFVNGIKVPYDDDGHGTHVAGDAAGNGCMSGGKYAGTAPAADIAALKVLGKNGEGSTSAIVKAIQWCIKNKKKHNIRVINMSLGDTAQKDYWNDPINQAVKKAYEAGLVVVAAAGNEGPDAETVGTPGDSPYAISIGAVDDRNTPDPSDDFITEFSSRGPTPGGLQKPDMVAPGEAIIAPMAPNTASETDSRESTKLMETLKWLNSLPDNTLAKVPPETLKMLDLSDETIQRWQKSPKQARKEIKRIFRNLESSRMYDDAYLAMPGTSMATPIAAGVVAKMLEANPDLTPGQVAEILRSTADKLPGNVPREDQGSGMVDPEEAIQKALDVKDGKLFVMEPIIEDHPVGNEAEA